MRRCVDAGHRGDERHQGEQDKEEPGHMVVGRRSLPVQDL